MHALRPCHELEMVVLEQMKQYPLLCSFLLSSSPIMHYKGCYNNKCNVIITISINSSAPMWFPCFPCSNAFFSHYCCAWKETGNFSEGQWATYLRNVCILPILLFPCSWKGNKTSKTVVTLLLLTTTCKVGKWLENGKEPGCALIC